MEKKLKVSKGFFLIAALLIYLDGQGLVLWYLCAMLVHEFGHLAVIYCLGSGVHFVRLTALGAEIKLDMSRPLSYGRECIAILAGPLASITAAWICAQCNWYLLTGANLSFGIINLFPIGCLDGGRILTCVLSMKWPNKADAVGHWISTVFSGILLGLGWTAWRRWGNLTLLLASVWLAAVAVKN